MSKFVKVATTGELASGQAKKVEVDGKVIALFALEGVITPSMIRVLTEVVPFPRGLWKEKS